MLNDPELIWAAGFFDGEGHISINTRNQIQMRVSQRMIEPLDRFQMAVNGGRVYPPGKRLNDCYQWVAWNQVAATIAEQLFPYLCSIKQEQIRSVMEKRTAFEAGSKRAGKVMICLC